MDLEELRRKVAEKKKRAAMAKASQEPSSQVEIQPPPAQDPKPQQNPSKQTKDVAPATVPIEEPKESNDLDAIRLKLLEKKKKKAQQAEAKRLAALEASNPANQQSESIKDNTKQQLQPQKEAQKPIQHKVVESQKMIEEPIVEEPIVEEPIAEEPIAEEPIVEEPPQREEARKEEEEVRQQQQVQMAANDEIEHKAVEDNQPEMGNQIQNPPPQQIRETEKQPRNQLHQHWSNSSKKGKKQEKLILKQIYALRDKIQHLQFLLQLPELQTAAPHATIEQKVKELERLISRTHSHLTI